MPYRSTQFVQGGYYHLYNRSAGKQSIFRSDANYLYLLRLLKQVAGECQITIIAYCLLPNHYHWLVRQDGEISLRNLPKRVWGSYAQAFNHLAGPFPEGGSIAHQASAMVKLHMSAYCSPVSWIGWGWM
jgi:REP element-mobilizing transposase RayT